MGIDGHDILLALHRMFMTIKRRVPTPDKLNETVEKNWNRTSDVALLLTISHSCLGHH
jgi:hypothetical protein